MDKIVFLDRDSIPPQIHFRQPALEHQWSCFGNSTPEEVIERARDASIIIVNKVILSSETIKQLPNVKHIAVIATGFNNISIDTCREQGIAVTNIQSYATTSVPEHTMGLILSLRRHLFAYKTQMQQQHWQASSHFHGYLQQTLDIANSQLGIIGGGELGQATAKLARALGMKVVFADRKNQAPSGKTGYVPFEQLICESDIISLNCPLTEETKDLISLLEMQKMKPSALLINTARGGLVNERDLVTAINNKIIAGAGFDVASKEPLTNDNPLLELLDKPNFILTPHVAWMSDQAMQLQADILIENIEAFAAGKSVNRIV